MSIVKGITVYSDFDNAVNGADSDACRFIMKADAVNTDGFIDVITLFTRGNSTYRTFRFACPAICAAVSNSMCHVIFLIRIDKS